MVRNIFNKREEVTAPEATKAEANQAEVQVVERIIDLNLINDKLNYITGVLHKFAKESGIDLAQ